MNPSVMEALNTIQWLAGNETITPDEEALLKDLALNGPPEAIGAALDSLKQAQWLKGNNRLTPEELAQLKQGILAPYREGAAGPPRLRWRHLVIEILADSATGAALQAILDEHGAAGWELAAAVPGFSAATLLVFKQPG